MPKKRKTISKKEVNSALKSIYRGDGSKKFDMKVRKIKTSPQNSRKILIGLIVFFALIFVVSWLGVLVFGRWGSGGAENLKLEISGEKKVVAGEEVEYEVKYQNKEDMPIAKADIGLYLPKSFILSESEPVLDDKNKLKLGTLKPNDIGKIKFKGKFFVTEGSKEVLQVVLDYKPSNFNSNFQKTISLEIEIIGSIFDGSLEGPDVLVVGDRTTYKLNYKNKSDEDLERVAIDAILPSDFIIATTTPQIGRKNRWEIGKLEGKSDGEVEINGSFSSDAKGHKEIILKLGIIDEEEVFLSLIEKKIETEVMGGDLFTKVLINGADDLNTARWGKPMDFSINYKNEGKSTLYDVELIMNIEGLPKEHGKSIIDWGSLQDPYNGKRKGDSIVWNKNQIKGLAKITPGGEGIIDFSVKIIPKPENPTYRDYKIDSQLEAEIARAGNVAVERYLKSKKITIYINSDANFRSQTRYYNDANQVVGSGPTPPKVGEKTTYKINWKVTNSMHELENVEVRADLGQGVVFSNSSSDAGEINLDSSLKRIVWTLNRMPTSVKEINANFDISITPESGDKGKILDLLKNIEFSAKDNSTDGIIVVKEENETTSLADDPYVSKGEVE